jgi:hypothetical protein
MNIFAREKDKPTLKRSVSLLAPRQPSAQIQMAVQRLPYCLGLFDQFLVLFTPNDTTILIG